MDTDLLKATWGEVSRFGDAVPLYFYAHLAYTAPHLRALFQADMAGQRDKLVAALGEVVSHVDNLGAVVPFLQHLGRDHLKYGATAVDYAFVGASLLDTLAHFLGDAFTPEARATWAEAYGIVAQVMTDAAAHHLEDR